MSGGFRFFEERIWTGCGGYVGGFFFGGSSHFLLRRRQRRGEFRYPPSREILSVLAEGPSSPYAGSIYHYAMNPNNGTFYSTPTGETFYVV